MKVFLLLMFFGITQFPLSLQANPGIYKKFVANYSNAKKLASISCMICHANTKDYTRNPYGRDLEAAIKANGGVVDFQMIENLDSDGDGYTNIQEIIADTAPGDPNDHP